MKQIKTILYGTDSINVLLFLGNIQAMAQSFLQQERCSTATMSLLWGLLSKWLDLQLALSPMLMDISLFNVTIITLEISYVSCVTQ